MNYEIYEHRMFENTMAAIREKGCFIYGAGILGTALCKSIESRGGEVLFFIDKVKKEIPGKQVLQLKDLSDRYTDIPIIVAVWAPWHSFADTRSKLSKKGFERIIPFQTLIWGIDELRPHYQFEKPSFFKKHSFEIHQMHGLLSDHQSQEVFHRNIYWRKTMDFSSSVNPIPNQYMPDFNYKKQKEIIIDCGAYTGDTLKSFIAAGFEFEKYYAFEPDHTNFEKLQDYVFRLPGEYFDKISPQQIATYSESGRFSFSTGPGGMCSKLHSFGSDVVHTFALDDLDLDVTFLKIDVEGADFHTLIGATHLIREIKPIIAVAVYHKPQDIWKIGLWLKKVNPGYKFYMRQYDYDGREIILYAIPPFRASK